MTYDYWKTTEPDDGREPPVEKCPFCNGTGEFMFGDELRPCPDCDGEETR